MTVYLENSIWTLLALAGLIVGIMASLDARGDLEALRLLHKNGQRKIIARTAYRSELIRVAVQLMFFVAGVVSFFSPPPTTIHTPAAIMLVLASGLLVCNSIMSFLARREALSLAEHDDTQRNVTRDAIRDEGRDTGRDPIRDIARDAAHDKETE